MQMTDLIGYLAALLVAAAFCMESIVALRTVALLSNIAFVAYGYLGGLMPVLLLHLVLLPVNLIRLGQTPQISRALHRWGVRGRLCDMAVELQDDPEST